MSRFILALLVVSPVLVLGIKTWLDARRDPLAGFHDQFREKELAKITFGEVKKAGPNAHFSETAFWGVDSSGSEKTLSSTLQKGVADSRKVYLLLGALVAILLASHSGPLPIFIILIAIPVYRRWYAESSKRRRIHIRKAIELEFPAVVELFSILVSAGESPSLALLHVSEVTTGKVSRFLSAAAGDLLNGKGFTRVLDELAAGIDSRVVHRFCDALIVATERGSALSEVLQRQVEDVRKFHQSQLIRQAGKAEISLMIPVVFLILPISVLFALWPSYMAIGIAMG